jgi:hypothetical protein
MDIQVVDQNGNEPQPLENKVPETTPVITGQMMEQSVGQMFDLLPSEISRYSDKIQTLIAYAKTQTDSTSPEALKWAIRSLQGRVGTPPLGQKWINYLGQYAWIKLESMKLQKEVENYEHSN